MTDHLSPTPATWLVHADGRIGKLLAIRKVADGKTFYKVQLITGEVIAAAADKWQPAEEKVS